jgi:deoxyribodipyrimidine photo-lyase
MPVWRRRTELQAMPPDLRPRGELAGLKSFESRLHWHCHFIQKLESEPELEFRNMHPAFAGLRDASFDANRLARWRRGETGFPLIDACMAMLRETGWINFRMRALLIAFSSYQLWQPWQKPALHLAGSSSTTNRASTTPRSRCNPAPPASTPCASTTP